MKNRSFDDIIRNQARGHAIGISRGPQTTTIDETGTVRRPRGRPRRDTTDLSIPVPRSLDEAKPLTDVQQHVVLAIHDLTSWGKTSTGAPTILLGPTHREIAKYIGVTNATGVGQHLDLIQRKGYLTHTPIRRSVRLTKIGLSAVKAIMTATIDALDQTDRIAQVAEPVNTIDLSWLGMGSSIDPSTLKR